MATTSATAGAIPAVVPARFGHFKDNQHPAITTSTSQRQCDGHVLSKYILLVSV